jgi:hypothetical protein
VQHPGRLAGGVPLDPAGRRVGGLPGDAGQLQRAAAQPGAVDVAVEQEHRPVADDGVEVLLDRQAAREVLHRPAAAGDPLRVGVLLGVPPDPVEVGLTGAVVVQRDPQPVQAGEGRVDVGVLEAGQHHPAGQVVLLGSRTDQLAHVLVGADGDDPVPPHGDRGGPAAGGVHAVDVRPGDHEVGGLGHGAAPGSAVVRHRPLQDGARGTPGT